MNSADFIYRGNSRQFVDSLCYEAKKHRAVKHPYFELFKLVNVIEADEALRDFIYQYSFYSRHFDTYNEAVLKTLKSPVYRRVILENIADEQGTGEAGFSGLPHRQMFSCFAERIGVDKTYRNLNAPLITAKVWGELFLQKCASPVPGVGLSAISIGTEFIVPDVYRRIKELIERSSFRDIEENYFFTLHCECDVVHSQQLIEALYDFCEAESHREAVRFGALSALNLRSAFFDVMSARLEAIRCRGKNIMTRKISTTELRQSGVEIAQNAYLI